ncbi:MAG: hypothetical protein M5U28_50725 [Sandaracinaceae bacterium]|nr:hypothetical protein [Sandaracinaceae bacterium]
MGVVRESQGGERRVGVAPPSIPKLVKMGFEVVVERGAGEASATPTRSTRTPARRSWTARPAATARAAIPGRGAPTSS